MSKTFMYFKKTGELYDKFGEYDGDDGFWFEYEVEDNKLFKALLELINDYYFESKANLKNIKSFITDFGMLDDLIEGFEEELKEYFEEEAIDSYER